MRVDASTVSTSRMMFQAVKIAVATEAKEAAADTRKSSPTRAEVAVDSLLQDWGSSNVPSGNDLNEDGTVDGIDLGVLLAQLQQTGAAPASTPTAAVEPTQPASSPIDALLGQWGSTDAYRHDLNDDGTVDGIDLGVLLAQLQQADAASAPAPTTPTEPTQPLSPIDSLLAEWGSTQATRQDLNEDGAVDGIDLGELLAQMQSASTPTDSSQAPADLATSFAQKIAEHVFGVLDHDGDGTIAIGEFPNAQRRIAGFDAESDGLITQRELAAGIQERFQQTLTGAPEADLAALAQTWMTTLTTPAETKENVQQVSRRIASRLAQADIAPAQVSQFRRSLDELSLTTTARRSMLSRLAASFPAGHGFSAIG